MAKVVRTREIEDEVEREVKRDFGPRPEGSPMDVAVRWAAAAFGVLAVAGLLGVFLLDTDVHDEVFSGRLVGVTIIVVGAVGYVVQRKRLDSWYREVDKRLRQRGA